MVAKSQPVADEGAAILDLLESWLLALRAGNKMPATLKVYSIAVRRYADWCEQRGLRPGVGAITRDSCKMFMDDLLHRTEPPLTPKSVRIYATDLKIFLNWCLDEGEIAANPMDRLALPHVVEQPPVILADVELGKLLKACDDHTFLGKRDTAILRLMIATPIRRAGIVGMRVTDVDLGRRLARVRNKGGREYICPFDGPAATALDRYKRERGRQKCADSEMLWLSDRGPLTGSGLYHVFRRRAAQAGLGDLGIHPHLTRGTWAVNAHKAGMSHQAIKRVASWQSSKMVEHYIGAAADDLAIEEYEEKLGKGRIK